MGTLFDGLLIGKGCDSLAWLGIPTAFTEQNPI